jgi:hypothetical protein
MLVRKLIINDARALVHTVPGTEFPIRFVSSADNLRVILF